MTIPPRRHTEATAPPHQMINVLFDFADPHTADAWQAIDDRVMGGISRSRLRRAPTGHAVFEGEVSLERNGGFASVRSSPGERGLPGAETCLIEVRGDPKHFKLSLLTDDGFDSLNYQASFTPAGGTWQLLHLPLTESAPPSADARSSKHRHSTPARIRQVGLMIASRQAGPFSLDIRRISLC